MRREADRFEEALQRAARGETIEGRLAPLVQTARQATILADPPPPPPHRLSPGQQRFLAEAARLRAEKTKGRRGRVRMTRVMKLATALITVVFFFGLVFSARQVAAASLPGDPLYGLKLAAEEVRLTLTIDPQGRADLNLALAEERLDEITTLMGQGQTIDDSMANRVEQQLMSALEAAVQVEDYPAAVQKLQRLDAAIQQRQQTMATVMEKLPEPEQMPVQQVLQAMERVSQEAQADQGDPDGLRQRLRHDTSSDPTDLPVLSHTPQPTPTPVQREPRPTNRPDTGPDPRPTHTPLPGGAGKPGGPHPSEQPGGPDSGPQPMHTPLPGGAGKPGGPHPSEQPGGPDSGPQPMYTPPPGGTGKPGGPHPSEQPGGPDSGPQSMYTPPSGSTGEPGGPGPQPIRPLEEGKPPPVQPPVGPGPRSPQEPGEDGHHGDQPPGGGHDGGDQRRSP